MAIDRTFASINEVREGKHVIMDDHPCRVMSLSHSKTGKHGAGKINAVGISIFDGSKHTLMLPAGTDVEIPIVERKRAQVVSVSNGMAQLMDLASYETFEVPVPQEMAAEMESGREIQYVETMGRRILERMMQE